MSVGSCDLSQVCRFFKINNNFDRGTLQEIHRHLDELDETTPRDLCAVVLLLVTKCIAQPSVFSNPRTRENYSRSSLSSEGLHTVALDFLSFQRDCKRTLPIGVTPPTFIGVAHHCHGLVKKQNLISQLLMLLYQYFLKYHYADERYSPNDGPDFKFSTETVLVTMGPNLLQFQDILASAFAGICSNTKHNLQDIMDFEYLWESSLLISRTHPVSPIFGINNEGDPTNLPESIGGSKRKQTPVDHNSATEKQRLAKELAWLLSRSINITDSQDVSTNGEKINYNRKHNIVKTSACIDIVIGATLASSSSRDEPKKDVAKKQLVEKSINLQNGDVVLSKVANFISPPHPLPYGEELVYLDSLNVNPRTLHNRIVESLVKSTNELIKAVTFQNDCITQFDIMTASVAISATAVPWFSSASQSDAKKIIVDSLSTHDSRMSALSRINSFYRTTLNKCKLAAIYNSNNVMIPQMSSMVPPVRPSEEIALKVASSIANFQQLYFIDPLGEFSRLTIFERKMLAPFTKNEDYGVCAIIFGGENISRDFFLRFYGDENDANAIYFAFRAQYSIHIDGMKSPTITREESTEMNEWITNFRNSTAALAVVKPSVRLLTTLRQYSTWKEVIITEVKYFVSIVAKQWVPEELTIRELSEKFSVSGDGMHTVPVKSNIMPSIVLRFYYCALDVILHPITSNESYVSAFILSKNFHNSLLSLCYFCIQKAMMDNASKNSIEHTIVYDIGDCPLAFFKLIDSFIESFNGKNHESECSLPNYLIVLLRQLQKAIIGLIWMTDFRDGSSIESSVIGKIEKLRQESMWPVESLQRTCPIGISISNTDKNAVSTYEDGALVDYIIRNLIAYTKQRVSAMCCILGSPTRNLRDLVGQVMMVYCTMLCHRIELFFCRHPDQLMMCALYLVCTKMGYAQSVTFNDVQIAYEEMTKDFLLPRTIRDMFERIMIHPETDGFGDLISLYNVSMMNDQCLQCNFSTSSFILLLIL